MKLAIVAVGKVRQPALRALIDDYVGRLRRYAACDEVEVKSDRDLERALPSDATIVALEVQGRTVTSTEFAELVERWVRQNKGKVAFVIGGADGIPRTLSESADERLSLSRMTLPHRLARAVLVEQLYRAMTILRGEPYARE